MGMSADYENAVREGRALSHESAKLEDMHRQHVQPLIQCLGTQGPRAYMYRRVMQRSESGSTWVLQVSLRFGPLLRTGAVEMLIHLPAKPGRARTPPLLPKRFHLDAHIPGFL